ncbi:hypothetical protein AAMO2058_000144300 [Amorphochlora amoebiformis]|mmetsp:Transcript_5888/g.9019  ORF Transcript_5888/g.9019 Transcript_5888/m.9019 type:complete len:196 (-) Transcript_5888:65-652(-)
MSLASSGSPDQKIVSDLQNLDKLSEQQLQQIVGFTLTTLTHGQLPEEQISEFAKENGIKPKGLKQMLSGLLFFLSDCLRRNLSAESVSGDLIKMGIKEKAASVVGKLWKGKFAKLAKVMKEKTLKVNELVDLQWKFGVTASSDSLQQVNTCFLQLKFVINTGNGVEDVLMEMTLPQFYKFLQQMEQAQRQCASYS